MGVLPPAGLALTLAVSVVVPCHAAAGTIEALLDALERQDLEPARFEILLADPEIDDTRAVVARRLEAGWSGADVRLVDCSAEGGPATKRNAAVAAARAPLLAFTDADCLPEPGWLSAGVTSAADADLVQGRVATPGDAKPGRFRHSVRVDSDHGLFESSNVFYARELFDSAGGFDPRWFERYGRPFGEDADLGWRAVHAGARTAFAADAVVRHPVGAATLGGHLGERWLVRAFPQLIREIPELRARLLLGGVFLSRDTLRFDAALAGLVLARRFPPALVLALPWLRSVAIEARGNPLSPGARLASDAVTFAALVAGTLRWRSLVL